jgi:hypothetical protein
MSSQQFTQTPSPIKVTTPKRPVKVVAAKAEKAVKEKVVAAKAEKAVKEKVVAAKAEKVVKEKVVAAKAEKVVKVANAEKVVKVVAAKAEKVVAAVEGETKVKKVRAAALPAKFNKFIQFSYYFIRTLNNASLEKNGEVLFDEDRFFEEANVFAAVDVQQRFVEGFLENKAIGKEMRTHLLDKTKAEKAAAKQKVLDDKAVAKKKVLDDKAEAKQKIAADKAAAKKTTTKKKSNKKEDPVDLVTSLVTLANENVSAGHSSTTTLHQVEDQDQDDEAELDVKVIHIEGEDYLIDESSNLYDSKTHLMIGIWDYVTKEITRV